EWVPDAQRHREQLGMSKIDVRREPGEQLGSGEPLLETTSDRPVDIAVLREQDVVLGRRDAAEEVLQKLRIAEPPVVVDLVVDPEDVVVEDVPAVGCDAVPRYER